MNGGFERTRSGLPVNWFVYSPSTIPRGDYELIFDRTDYKQGEQSLRFLVRECSSEGGWRSPGIFQEYPATPGASYRISFWIKNEGSDWVVRYGGVAAKTAHYESIDASSVAAGAWRRVEQRYTMPREYASVRFELSIRAPGSVWIDDVRIERIPDDAIS